MSPIREEWVSDDGSVRLLLGDCLEILPTIGKVDAVVTDPPYGVSGAVSGRRKQDRLKTSTNYLSTLWNDDEDNLVNVTLPAIKICIQNSDRCALTPGFKHLWKYPEPKHVGNFYYGAQSATSPWGMCYWQPILFYGSDPHPMTPDTIQARPNPSGIAIDHPCPKEIKTWQKLLERSSLESDLVLDPFTGSGTTGVACVRTKRSFIGIEIEKKYFEIAKRRIQDEYEKLEFLEPKKQERQVEMFI